MTICSIGKGNGISWSLSRCMECFVSFEKE
jgi:hypothetical protein